MNHFLYKFRGLCAASVCFCSTLFADGQMWVEFTSYMKLECDVSPEISIVRSVRGKAEKPTYVLRLTSPALVDNWIPMNITLHTQENGFVTMKLRSNSAGTEIYVDKVTVSGSILKNGDFEETAEGHPIGWDRNQVNEEHLITDSGRAYSGSHFARVNIQKLLQQRLEIKKDVPLKLSLFYRPAKVSELKPPEGANHVFVKTTGSLVVISEKRFETVPSYENCSYYLTKPADDRGKKQRLEIFFRQKGTSEWKKALSPVYVYPEHAWRGSIFGLKENTCYEVKARLSGDKEEILNTVFLTKNSAVPIAKTIEIDPADFSGTLEIKESGKASGYIRYTVKNSGVLTGKREYGGPVILVSNAGYLVFENLNIKANMSRHCLKLDNCENIIVRNCDFSDFGRSDYVRSYKLQGSWTYKGERTGWDGGLFMSKVKDILVERCLIHRPASGSNSWFYSHPTGPEAIFVDQAKGGIVLRYNDFVASDARPWNDAVETFSNFHIKGGLMRDGDVYGNLFAFADDDGIEAEGGGMNLRLYLNRFEGGLCGISTSSCVLGPTYMHRNLFNRLRDEDGTSVAAFKNGCIYDYVYGAIYITNNTVLNCNLTSSTRGFDCSVSRSRDPEKFSDPMAVVENNIFECCYNPHLHLKFMPWVYINNNLIDFRHERYAKTNQKLLAEKGMEKDSLWTRPVFRNEKTGDLRLKAGTPGSGRAVNLPNLETRDLGAFQDDGILLPHRPVSYKPDKLELFFANEQVPLSQNFTVGVEGRESRPFNVICNDDFFTVTPMTGIFSGGKNTEFTISIKPEKMPRPKLYRGMILLRTQDGFSRPISVYADFRNSPARIQEADKHAIMIPLSGKNQTKFKGKVSIPEDGCYFLFVKGSWHDDLLKVSVNLGGVRTNDAARLKIRTPADANELLGSVNDGSMSGFYFFLKKGETELEFESRSRLTEVKCFYLTREPEWFLR